MSESPWDAEDAADMTAQSSASFRHEAETASDTPRFRKAFTFNLATGEDCPEITVEVSPMKIGERIAEILKAPPQTTPTRELAEALREWRDLERGAIAELQAENARLRKELESSTA